MALPDQPANALTARYDITIYDYADWLEYRNTPKRKPSLLKLLWQVSLALCFTVLVVIAIRNPKKGSPCPVWLAVILAIVAFGFAFYYQLRNVTANYRREALRTAEAQDPATRHDIQITATTNALTLQHETGMELFTWDRIARISFSKERHIFIDIVGSDGIIVPNSAFETKALAQSFYDHTIEYWRNAHGKIIRTI